MNHVTSLDIQKVQGEFMKRSAAADMRGIDFAKCQKATGKR